MGEEKLYTLDEARAMIDETAPPVLPPDNMRTVTVDGLTVTVDVRRVRSWTAAGLVAKADDPNASEFQRISAMMKLYEFIFADGLKDVLAHFGGADVANVGDVMGFFQSLMVALEEKN